MASPAARQFKYPQQPQLERTTTVNSRGKLIHARKSGVLSLCAAVPNMLHKPAHQITLPKNYTQTEPEVHLQRIPGCWPLRFLTLVLIYFMFGTGEIIKTWTVQAEVTPGNTMRFKTLIQGFPISGPSSIICFSGSPPSDLILQNSLLYDVAPEMASGGKNCLIWSMKLVEALFKKSLLFNMPCKNSTTKPRECPSRIRHSLLKCAPSRLFSFRDSSCILHLRPKAVAMPC